MSVLFETGVLTRMVIQVNMILILRVLFIKLIQKEVGFVVDVINI